MKIKDQTVSFDLSYCFFLQTREELRNALEDETRAFNVDKDLSSSYVISWNHQEFEVQYNSLSDEIKIGERPNSWPEFIQFELGYIGWAWSDL